MNILVAESLAELQAMLPPLQPEADLQGAGRDPTVVTGSIDYFGTYTLIGCR